MTTTRWGLLVALAALGATQCGGTTGGHLISMPLEAGGPARDVSQPFTFTSGQGWTVTLTAAQVVVGPLYFNIDAPEPSVFRSGVVIVQATEQLIVDMLDPTLHVVPGGADGETGHAVSVEVGLYTTAEGYNDTISLPAPLSADGQVGTAYLAGQASKNGAVVPFAGRVQITGSLVTGTDPVDELARVAGALCDLTFTTTSGPVTLRVDPSRWFDQANFCILVEQGETVSAGDGGSPDAATMSSTDGGALTADGGALSVDGGAPSIDGGIPAVAPCVATPGQVYDWSDTNPFNSQVLAGMGHSVGVYEFGFGS